MTFIHLPRVINPAASLGALLALTGCFELNQKTVVEGPDKATIQFALSMNASLVAAIQIEGQTGICAQGSNSEEKDGVRIAIEGYSERGELVCKITATGSLDDLAALIRKNAFVPAVAAHKAKEDFDLSLTKLDDGSYRFFMSIAGPKEAMPVSNDAFGEAAKLMMLNAVSGRSISWSMTAPKIVKTNGRTSEDGKVVTHSVALAEFLTKPGTKHEFDVTFQPESGFLARLKAWFK